MSDRDIHLSLLMFEQLHLFELPLIEKLQHLRNPFLDHVMIGLNYVDSTPAWLFLVLLVTFLYRHKVGFEMLFLLLLSAVLNQDLKALFAQPRPLDLEPALGLVKLHSFGFPSGAAQTVLLLSGFFAWHLKKASSWILCTFFILLISFSRIYLGVHFFSDVVGGWIAGALLLTAYLYLLGPLERWIKKSSKPLLYLFCCVASGALAALCITHVGVPIALFGLGVGLGLIWNTSLNTPKLWKQKMLRLLITCLVITLILFCQYLFHHHVVLFWIFSILGGLWISYGTFVCCHKLEMLFRGKR